jgi:hypothetical protein
LLHLAHVLPFDVLFTLAILNMLFPLNLRLDHSLLNLLNLGGTRIL